MASPSNGSPANPAVGLHHIRTLALVGPSAAGKTSIAEALLLKSGAITSAGTL